MPIGAGKLTFLDDAPDGWTVLKDGPPVGQVHCSATQAHSRRNAWLCAAQV